MKKLKKSLGVALLIAFSLLMTSCGTKTYSSTEHITCTVTNKQHTTSTSYIRSGKVLVPHTSHYYYIYVTDGNYNAKCSASLSEYSAVEKGTLIKVYRITHYKVEDDSVDKVNFELHI